MYDNIFQPVQTLIEAPRIFPGGLCEVIFTPIENVLTWPEVNVETGGIDADIVLKPGAEFYTAELEKSTKEFIEDTKDSPAGHFHDKLINATLPGNVAENVLALGNMKFYRFLVIFKDKSGHFRFLGDEDSGAKIDYMYKSGDGDSSRNRDIKITWSSQHPAPIYQGSLTNIPIPSGGGSFMFIEAFKVKAGQPIAPGESSYTNPLIEDKKVFVIINEQKILSQSVNNMDADRYIDKADNSDTWTLVDAAGDPVEINENDNIEIYVHD